MLQSIYNIGQAAATFDRHYHDTTDVAAMARRESEEFTYSWGYGFNDVPKTFIRPGEQIPFSVMWTA